ncbi:MULTISPECIES: hypothetical protein [Rhodomicrobium]|uniref:hypothetical protein n=1 Tax=Rhodomicrobium TaxID=1068 RepID=UPI000B4A9E5F|nr:MULTISPECIES: hypothetical protein [Rhodomicrobium]
MSKFPTKITAFALFGMVAMASGAQAGGLYDSDDDSYKYNRESLSRYCYQHPYDDACDPYAKKHRKRESYNGKGNGYGRCAPLVRAVGKRNLVTAFARNSARFAWIREARFVHGDRYASWSNAHNAEITCTRVGGLKSCVATATPCR